MYVLNNYVKNTIAFAYAMALARAMAKTITHAYA